MELGRWLIHAFTISIVLLLHINASALSLVHHHANVTARCIDRERDALLAIIGDLVDEYNLLSSWGSEDCCRWERVHCDPHTGHVIQLHLGGVFELLQHGLDRLEMYPQMYFLGLFYQQGQDILKNFGGQFNQLSGSLPSQLCHLPHLQILDVSVNEISGTIPKCLNNLTSLAQEGNSNLTIRHSFNISEAEPPMTSLYYEDDATFMWKGTLASYKSTLGLVKRIDLSSNRLTGEIPSEITYLVGLVSLNLSRNSLSGQIPLDIGKLKSLDSLDLSRNKIHGGIPTSLAHIDRLGTMDLSYNNLSGEIPTGTQLQGFNASSYIENPWLCGLPLHVCDPEGTGRPNVSSGEDDANELITQGFYISLGLGFAVGFWGICGSLIFKKSWRYAYYNFLNASNDWLYVKLLLFKRLLHYRINDDVCSITTELLVIMNTIYHVSNIKEVQVKATVGMITVEKMGTGKF
ncbi:PREDICTED: receptor-like protein 12 [Fragaria vesca subsp. vesca]|uniref:receptor-like protein 12 n=1 Tax=Fragaria vesca subsp. vesca TaxID=101020 RepID=UPI0002C33121|nr:PREDICTED: receptor-like protein 12 [Fragaria vesca subsp. vesca]